MTRSWTRIATPGLLLLLMVVALGGCKPNTGPRAYTIDVALDDSIRDGGSSIEVDVVGINPDDDAIRNADYRSGKSLRQAAGARTVTFSPDDTGAKRVAQGDPAWKGWLDSGAAEVLIIANYLPGMPSDPAAHRLILPLGRQEWESETLRIRVLDSALRCVTPRKPKE